MHCSVAKFIVDAEQCAMAHRMASGVNFDDFDEALSAVPDVGPGGHYLGHPHTQENFQSAFFMPQMFDNNAVEQWAAEGSIETPERFCPSIRNRCWISQWVRRCAITSPDASVKFRQQTS